MVYRCFIVFFLCNSIALNASYTNLKFQHLSVQDGLSRSWVKCIYQDSYGYMWFGTSDGLNRYDGYEFTVYKYDASQPKGINSNIVNLIFEDIYGQLWVGTQEGLNLYNRDQDNFEHSDLVPNYIDCKYEFPSGKLLIGSGGGLFLIDTKEKTTRQIYNDIHVADILLDSRQNLWLATSRGLRWVDTADYSYREFNMNHKNGVADDYLHCLYEDWQGRIWAGTTNDGLSIFSYTGKIPDEIRLEIYRHNPDDPSGISRGAILDIAEDPEGNIWIGIENGGLNVVKPQKETDKIIFEHYKQVPGDATSLSSNSIHTFFTDKHQTTWIGTYGGGINYHNKLLNKFSHIQQIPGNANSLNNNNVNTILEDSGVIWLGTEGGLTRFNPVTNIYTHYTYDPAQPGSISANAVWSIHRGPGGHLWIGTWAGGLNRFDANSNTFTHFFHDVNDSSSIGANSVYDIITDSAGRLWFATMGGGVSRLRASGTTFDRYTVDYDQNSISNNWIFKLLETRHNEIWISTTEAIDVYDKKTEHITTFEHDPEDSSSIGYNGALDMFEDSRGNIWLGTSAGLELFQRHDSTFRHFTVKDGLPNNTIKAIIEDDNGNLWLSTNKGLSKFLNAVNLPEEIDFQNYDVSDGLQGNEFNSRAVAKMADGRILFGGINGFNIFHPDSIRDNPYLPEIRFSNLYVFNKEVIPGQEGGPLDKHISQTRELVLPYKYSVFSITYAALSYLAADKNQYAFILEGFEDHWNYVGTQRMATYTNLNPGKYTFRVKASNSDGLWNNQGASLEIVILPPWWGTGLAKILYVLLVFASLYFFRRLIISSFNLKNRLKLEQLEKQKASELNALKLQFFTNISHELRTPLTLINAPLNKLLNADPRSEELKKVRRNFSRLRTLVNQILDFRAIESDSVKVDLKTHNVIGILKNMVENFVDLAEQHNLTLRYRSDFKQLSMEIDKDKFEKILTNLIINAIQYTQPGGDILVNAEEEFSEERYLKISVSDSGKGIPEEDLNRIFDRFYTYDAQNEVGGGTGIGLHLTKRYIELLGGKITVNSKIGEGSVFSVFLPGWGSNAEEVKESFQLTKPLPLVTDSLVSYVGDQSDSQPEHQLLVIDDNAEMCKYIEEVLQKDFQIVTLVDSRMAFNQVIQTMPDLIVCDVMMPYINGYELCRQFKSDMQTSHIPIILLTAKAALNDKLEGLQFGADAYISKPFEEELLITYAQNLIQQRKLLREYYSSGSLEDPMAKAENSLDRQFLTKVKEIIQNNYNDSEFSVNHIVEKIGMSRTVFYSKYKSLSEQSINDTIKSFRLKQAQQLLLGQKHTVNEVATKCGFNDASYFGKVFKEHYNLTPREFINSRIKREGLN